MTHTRRPMWRLLAALAALGLVAGACGDDDGGGDDQPSDTTFASEGGTVGEQEEATAAFGGNIVVGLEGESAIWTPGESELTAGGITVAYSIYDPLISLDRRVRPVPRRDLRGQRRPDGVHAHAA